MNCTQVKELLSRFYDAELMPDDREGVRAHLGSCAECSSELARFGALSGMMRRLPTPAPSEQGWEEFEERLAENSTIQVAPRAMRRQRPLHRSWLSLRDLRPAIAVAAILLVAVVWFAVETWFGHAGSNLLAADIRQYMEEFERDPEAAQQILLAKYDGRKFDLDEAARRVSYEPAAAAGLPQEYTVGSMYLLRMPCCDCLQTICQRDDGAMFVVFEYGEEHPASTADRLGGMAPCRGENCCLVQISGQFAATGKKRDRYVSIVGIRDQAERDNLMAGLE